ncbi:MAG TPA: preprotein translocase subunit SecG [Bacteroidota bacterium]
MYTVFIVVEIIISVLMIITILMQASKGGGLAGSLGGSNIGTVFGVRRASDFLSKTTTILATLFMVLALFINLTVLPRGEQQESVIQSVPPPSTLPPSSAPATQPSQPAATPNQQPTENK